MDILTSDTAILVLSCAGLMATAVSIVRDARSQRKHATIEELPVIADAQERLAA
jgi:hypothetical protein